MASPWRFLPCPSCCEGCEYFSDAFTRADAPTPGANWNVVAGTWPIVSNKLQTTSSNGACVCTATHPDGLNEVVADVYATGNTDNDTLRIIADYVDANTYWYGEIKFGAGGWYRIGRHQWGFDFPKSTYSTPITTGSPYPIRLCIANGVIHFGTSTRPYVQFGITPTSDLCGVGTGAIGAAVQFDDFTLNKHKHTYADCPTCNEVCSNCLNGYAPGAFLLEFGVAPTNYMFCNDCAGFDKAFVLPSYFLGGGVQGCVYRYVWAPGDPCPAFYGGFDLKVTHLGIPASYEIKVWLLTAAMNPLGVTWEKNYGGVTRPDCINLNGESLPNTATLDSGCHWGATNILLTAQ